MKQTIQCGDVIDNRTLFDMNARALNIPDASKLTHLQFRRFAGCPICSEHLHTISTRYENILAAGVVEVVVFRSSASALQHYFANSPFAVIADPDDKLYAEFGVTSGLRAILAPRALGAGLRGVVGMFPKIPPLAPGAKGAFGLPADFLIAPTGHVIACKYGAHAYDQWSVNEVICYAQKQPQFAAATCY